MDYEFKINNVPYHFNLITEKERDRRASFLESLGGVIGSRVSRGRVEYTIGNSKDIKKGRFYEHWTEEPDVSVGRLEIYFAGRKIHRETFCNDDGTGNENISIKRRGHRKIKIDSRR